jgi:hypothetical protein
VADATPFSFSGALRARRQSRRVGVQLLMATLKTDVARIQGHPGEHGRARRGWAWQQYLAVVAVPFLVWETWTLAAWLADGPHQITEYRDVHSASWYATWVLQISMILVSVAVIVYVVRGCRREGRILTFDVMFCLVGATVFWADDAWNFYQPAVLFNSNFINLNSQCGHMPFVVNPDCGRAPDPILFYFLLETFGMLGLAFFLRAGTRWARGRWPRLSVRHLVGLVLLSGLLFDLVLEPAIVIPLKLWWYMAPRWMSVIPGFPIVEIFYGGLWFGLMAAVWIFRDDQGLTIFERGLNSLSRPKRNAVTLLALYAFVQLITWGISQGGFWVGFYNKGPWPELPAYVVNGVCDAPGFQNTRYGTCPGAPGYRMPGRHSLPGKSP